MNSNRVYIHGYCSPCKPFFYFIFSLLYQTTSLPQPLQQLVRQNQLKINQTHLLKINQNQPSINWKLTQNQQKINPNTSTQTNLHRDKLAIKKKKKHREIGAYRNNQCLTGMIGARGYGSCLIGACGSELSRSVLAWSELWIDAWLERSELVGLAWSELMGMGLAWSVLVDRSCRDWCLPDRSCGSVLVTEMVWIRQKGRVDSETSWI